VYIEAFHGCSILQEEEEEEEEVIVQWAGHAAHEVDMKIPYYSLNIEPEGKNPFGRTRAVGFVAEYWT
jgi:hypothetical protein